MPNTPTNIKASEMLEDIHKGMDDDGLMKKYELSATQLASVFTKLIDAKKITQEELDSRCMVGKPTPSKPINSVTAREALEQTTKTRSCLSGNHIKRSGVHSAGESHMTDETLTKERNYFLAWFLVLVGGVLGINFTAYFIISPDVTESMGMKMAFITLILKGVFIYLVFRLSRFLRQPVWLTVVYCILTPLPFFYLIPFIGLLVGVKKARRALS